MRTKREIITQPSARPDAFAYQPDFLSARVASELHRELLHCVAWRRETLRMFGREVMVPREVAWCGDAGVVYRYAGVDHEADGWLARLQEIRVRLRDSMGVSSNFVLLNRYRSGADYMGWHRDDEPGVCGPVASVSLGATRRFLVRTPGAARSRRLDLEPGSLLMLAPDVRHSLPRAACSGERINLTFRCIGTPAARRDDR